MSLSSDVGFLALSSALLGVCTHVWLNCFDPVAPAKVLAIVLAAPATTLLIHNLSFALSFSTIFISYVVYLLSLTLSLFTYRLSPLHPLAKYPGPTIANLTDFWGAWQCWNGRQHTVTKALHDRYGPVIRVAPNKLSIVDVDIVASVLSTTGLPKGQSYDTRQDPKAPGNLFVLKGKEHAARRRLWTRGMNPESLKEYEVILRARVSQLVHRLGEVSKGGALDIASWLGYFSFDFMGDMAFGGVGYELMKAGKDDHGVWGVILNSNRTGAVLGHVPWATKLFILIPGFFTDLLKLRKMGIQFATARLKKGSTVKDLWYHLADDANLEKTKPSFGNVVADGAFTIVAGSDTSATVLTTFFYYMLQHSEYMRKVQAEIDGIYRRGGDAFDELKNPANVPFLNACLKETLRLQPPVPSGGTRRVVGDRERLIAGTLIPTDIELYAPAYALHRDPRYFHPHPNAFWPSRWLFAANARTPPPSEQFIHNATAFIPFSSGPASCAAKSLAWLELRAVAGALVHAFEVRAAGPLEGWEAGLLDHFVLAKAPLRVVLTPRRQRDV